MALIDTFTGKNRIGVEDPDKLRSAPVISDEDAAAVFGPDGLKQIQNRVRDEALDKQKRREHHYAQRVERRKRIVNLFLEGKTRREIAILCGCSYETVKAVLRVYRKVTDRHLSESETTLRNELVVRHQLLAREAFDAWERSKTDEVVETVEKMAESDAVLREGRARVKVRKQTSKRDGNPMFLAQAERHLSEIAKLLGLHAPQKTEISGPGGGAIDLRVDEQRLLPVRRMVERELRSGSTIEAAREHLLGLGVQSDDLDTVLGLLAAADRSDEVPGA